MKHAGFLFLSFLFPTCLVAQVNATIGTQETPVYPLAIDKIDLSDELEPLKALFSSKSIIGMGEATHGTREFFELKHGVFQWLVSTCDYRVFGIEATYGGCCYINDFVQSGVGDIEHVMAYLDFLTWQTEEVRALILWMKDYNMQAQHLEKLSFYGFDMQNFYAPVQYLNDFTKQHYATEYAAVQAISFPILGKTELQIYQLLQNKDNKFEDSLKYTHKRLSEWLVENKGNLETSQTGNSYMILHRCIDNFGQAIRSLSVKNISKFRDSCMAYNILAIQQFENRKMFVWAHNGHVNLAYPDNNSELMGLLMGGHLKKNIGAAYYAIGFVFNQGEFQAIQGPRSFGNAIFKYLFARKKMYQGLKVCSVPIQSKNTFSIALSKTPYPAYFVDISRSDNPVFSTLLKTYDVGSIFMHYKRCTSSIDAKKQFDGMIYVDQTRSARPIELKRMKK